jgi:hypothetical protein
MKAKIDNLSTDIEILNVHSGLTNQPRRTCDDHRESGTEVSNRRWLERFIGHQNRHNSTHHSQSFAKP